jgi:hypothetical protein
MPKVPKKKPTASAASHPYQAARREPTKPRETPQLEMVGVEEMRQLGAASREKFGKAKCTREQYQRYVEHGKDFLAACVQQRRELCETAKDGVDDELLAKAFDKPPNKMSAEALELFLVHKCLREECGSSTSVSIHSAFAWYWDNMSVTRH